MLLYILWNVKPQLIQIGSFEVRWYGLLFALGFLIGQYILIKWYKAEGKPEKDVERITLFVVLGTVIGARLGHCLFYEPDFYLSNPIEILKIWKGGLASHGAAIGILLGLYLYARKTPGQSYFYVLDRLVILVAIGGGFIRLGNLMNSEIIGKTSDSPIAFVFSQSASNRVKEYYPDLLEEVKILRNDEGNGLTMDVSLFETSDTGTIRLFAENQILSILGSDGEINQFVKVNAEKPINVGPTSMQFPLEAIGRHPTQLYESLSYFLIAFFLYFFIYKRENRKPTEGKIFSFFLILLFGIRIFHEMLKENQVPFEEGLGLNLGQLLSIPLVLAGILIFLLKVRPEEKAASQV